MGIYAIVKYICEVAGKPTDTVDYQVRYFSTNHTEVVKKRLNKEEPSEYKNYKGETVRWTLEELMSIEIDPALDDGEEIIGFITGSQKEIRR